MTDEDLMEYADLELLYAKRIAFCWGFIIGAVLVLSVFIGLGTWLYFH